MRPQHLPLVEFYSSRFPLSPVGSSTVHSNACNRSLKTCHRLCQPLHSFIQSLWNVAAAFLIIPSKFLGEIFMIWYALPERSFHSGPLRIHLGGFPVWIRYDRSVITTYRRTADPSISRAPLIFALPKSYLGMFLP